MTARSKRKQKICYRESTVARTAFLLGNILDRKMSNLQRLVTMVRDNILKH